MQILRENFDSALHLFIYMYRRFDIIRVGPDPVGNLGKKILLRYLEGMQLFIGESISQTDTLYPVLPIYKQTHKLINFAFLY